MSQESAADLAAERAILGCVLLVNDAILDALDVPPAAMHHPAHAVVWAAMLALHERREGIDVVTMAAELRSMGRLNTVGGVQLLGELTDEMPTAAHIATYARIVLECWRLRQLSDLGRELTAHATVGADAGVLLARIERVSTDVSAAARGLVLVPIADGFDAAVTALESANEPSAATHLSLGLRDVDTQLGGGVERGYVTILGARPGLGKTSFALQAAAHWAAADLALSRQTGQPPPVTAFFSLEMPLRNLVNRLLAVRARIDVSHLSANHLTDSEWTALQTTLNADYDLPLWVTDQGEVTVRALAAACRRIQRTRGLRGVVIDYLQLVKCDEKGEKRNEDVAQVSRALRLLAKELDVPILALSQLNRGAETEGGRGDKRPALRHLRESGDIEQDAAAVVFIYRDEVYNKDTDDRGIAELIVAKSRNSATGTARARWVATQTAFRDMEEENGFGHGALPAPTAEDPWPMADG